MNLKEALHENVYNVSRQNHFPITHLQTTMSKRTSHELFSTIYESYYTILVNFYLYL